ncbi:small integral membrane protein 20 isoform X3 [Myotis daubentonii]|uniref:small integral membrane protein 20 isoform X3 n=1 Tax=Myotis daubentonii TaxID=98922 RepID=UPI002873CA85|nr:small integral membrane protein 20 isoform X3 [Myotis daubentonii]
MSQNLRTALIFGGFISLIGAAFYPIYFRPLMRPEEYRNEKAVTSSDYEIRHLHALHSAASAINHLI